ncbi:hypothetical protein Tco_0463298, partial [Tanacetum coccineum]
DLAVPTSGSNEDDIPPSLSIPFDVPAGATTGPSADPSNKGKSPLLEEDTPVRERTFRQREEDRLGEEAARRFYEEEKAELERERRNELCWRKNLQHYVGRRTSSERKVIQTEGGGQVGSRSC